MSLSMNIFFCLRKNNDINMSDYFDWKWKATKISSTGEYSEELTYLEIAKFLMSANFMIMLKRMRIGEELFNNENNIKFQRIS